MFFGLLFSLNELFGWLNFQCLIEVNSYALSRISMMMSQEKLNESRLSMCL